MITRSLLNKVSFYDLPDRLIDYILIHELCHTLHRNHGPAFHALLDRMTEGKHRLLQKELRDYSTRWGR